MSGLTNNVLHTTYRLRAFFRDDYDKVREGEMQGWRLDGFDLHAKALDDRGPSVLAVIPRMGPCTLIIQSFVPDSRTEQATAHRRW